MIEVKVIEDSIPQKDCEQVRLTTLQLTYPRFIHAEMLTHRVFSRNASSSRAIPVKKMLQMVRDEPATTCYWGMEQSGMQSYVEADDHTRNKARLVWKIAALQAVASAEELMGLGIHKQFANRLLEPFQHIKVVVTATEWDNFFELRDHPAAEPNIQALAKAMHRAMDCSIPRVLDIGKWHLPYIGVDERESLPLDVQIKCSVARCARTSYMNHDQTNPVVEKDIDLHDRLIVQKPAHASPAEHQAQVLGIGEVLDKNWTSNLKNWRMYRKFIENGVDVYGKVF